MVMGVAPARQSGRVPLVDALKTGGRAMTSGASSKRLRNALVVLEIAVALTLLVGAGFLASFRQLMAIDLGFDYHNVVFLNGIGLRFDQSGKDGSRWTWRVTDPPPMRLAQAREYSST